MSPASGVKSTPRQVRHIAARPATVAIDLVADGAQLRKRERPQPVEQAPPATAVRAGGRVGDGRDGGHGVYRDGRIGRTGGDDHDFDGTGGAGSERQQPECQRGRDRAVGAHLPLPAGIGVPATDCGGDSYCPDRPPRRAWSRKSSVSPLRHLPCGRYNPSSLSSRPTRAMLNPNQQPIRPGDPRP